MKIPSTQNADDLDCLKPHFADKRPQSDPGAKPGENPSRTESGRFENKKFAHILDLALTPPDLEKGDEFRKGFSDNAREDDKNISLENKSYDQPEDGAETDLNDNSICSLLVSGNAQNTAPKDVPQEREIISRRDLERIISAVQTRINFAGRDREVLLELNQSILNGLKVKIVTDPSAQVRIEFLVNDRKSYLKINSHLEELDRTLRSREIKLTGLKVYIDPDHRRFDFFSRHKKSGTAKTPETEKINSPGEIETNIDNATPMNTEKDQDVYRA